MGKPLVLTHQSKQQVFRTPYGINTHRLLVRGHRVDNQPEARTVRVTADAMQIEPVLVAPLVAVPMLFVLLVLLLVKTRRKK